MSSLDAWRRLGCAVLLQAVKDVREGNGHSAEARSWLAGGGAVWLVGLLDLDPAGLAVALAGLPRPVAVQLALPGLGAAPAIRGRGDQISRGHPSETAAVA